MSTCRPEARLRVGPHCTAGGGGEDMGVGLATLLSEFRQVWEEERAGDDSRTFMVFIG